MNTFIIVLIVIAVILAIVLGVLYFLGRKAQKTKDEQKGAIAANSQTISMLVIDKKRMPIKDAGLPDIVTEQTPWYLKRSKVPVVKAKVGPKIMTLIADYEIFDQIPVKKEVKAVVSGIYITAVKGLRVAREAETEKKGFFSRFKKK